MHNGVDTADVLIFPRRQAGMCVRIVGQYDPGIERTAVTVLETADVRNRVFSRGGILPSDRGTRGHGSRFRNEVRRSAVDNDGGVRRRRRCWPRRPCHDQQHGDKSSSVDGVFHILISG